jgi:hypothetical protein
MGDSTPPVRISEQEAASLLDRAARLDAARGKEVDVSELRGAAVVGSAVVALPRKNVQPQLPSASQPEP